MCIFRQWGGRAEKPAFQAEDFSLRQRKAGCYVAGSALFEMQGSQGLGLFPLPEAAKQGPGTTPREAGHRSEERQQASENKGSYHQIADVLPEGGNILVAGHFGRSE